MPFPSHVHVPGIIGRAGGAPAWTPASFPSLTGWWSMKRSPGLPAVGADITSWQDLSGNARHFARRLTTAMPAHQTRNTYPAAEFVEASAESLQISTALSTMIGNTGLMAAVCELNGQPTGTSADTDALYYRANGILFDANPGLTDGAYWGMFCSFEAAETRWNMGIFDTAGRGLHGTITAGARHILMMRRDSTTLFASLDGGAELTVTASAPSNTAHFLTLGANSGGTGAKWFNGWIYEAVASTSNGVAGDRTSLIAYLKAEWGIP